MTSEQQRIAIAKVRPQVLKRLTDAQGDWWWYFDSRANEWVWCFRNDPLQDLNAIHEVEKALTQAQGWEYAQNLVVDVGKGWFATASERAEAFLRTMGEWKNT